MEKTEVTVVGKKIVKIEVGHGEPGEDQGDRGRQGDREDPRDRSEPGEVNKRCPGKPKPKRI